VPLCYGARTITAHFLDHDVSACRQYRLDRHFSLPRIASVAIDIISGMTKERQESEKRPQEMPLKETYRSVSNEQNEAQANSCTVVNAMPASRAVWIGVIGVVMALLPRSIQADIFSTFGAGARAGGMAGGGSALADDFTALFACPALMAFGPSSLGVGFVGGVNRLGVHLSPRPAGYDPPDLGSASPVIPYSYRLRPRADPDHPPDILGFTVGGSASAGLDWLRLGGYAYIPLVGLGRQFTYFADEREQYFSNTVRPELYGEQLASQQVMTGVALLPLDWLALGAGLMFGFSSRSDSQVLIPDMKNQSYQELNLQVETGLALSAIAGIAARFLDHRLIFAVTFRDRQCLQIHGRTEVQMAGVQGTEEFPFFQDLRLNVLYQPRALVLAGGWKDKRFGVAVDLTWQQWSDYRDNHDELAGFKDTWNIRVGGEWRPVKRLVLRGGFGFRPSPVPEQTGRTNFVDNDMFILGVGGGTSWDVHGKVLEIQAFTQAEVARARSTTKARLAKYPRCEPGVTTLCDEVPDDTRDPVTGKVFEEAAGLQTGNPGFPGFSSGGVVVVAGVEVLWKY